MSKTLTLRFNRSYLNEIYKNSYLDNFNVDANDDWKLNVYNETIKYIEPKLGQYINEILQDLNDDYIFSKIGSKAVEYNMKIQIPGYEQIKHYTTCEVSGYNNFLIKCLIKCTVILTLTAK